VLEYEEWTRFSDTFVVPPSTSGIELNIIIWMGAGTKVTAAMLNRGGLAPYFSGEYPWQYGTEWRGDDWLSVSDMYPEAPLKAARLTATLGQYLPRGMDATVETASGNVIASTL
jgi:hypothetical protein